MLNEQWEMGDFVLGMNAEAAESSLQSWKASTVDESRCTSQRHWHSFLPTDDDALEPASLAVEVRASGAEKGVSMRRTSTKL